MKNRKESEATNSDKKAVYRFENLEITCDNRCPFFYCGEPCKILKHAEKYSKIIKERGYEDTIL